MMRERCKRCLLLAAGEAKSYEQIKQYVDNLDDDLKVTSALYDRRLSLCKTCDYLISGMCLKCGCYVELRAALKNKACPNPDDVRWEKSD